MGDFISTTQAAKERSQSERRPNFATKAEAMANMLSFRLSWEYRSKGRLYEPTEEDLAPTSAFAVSRDELPAGKSLNSLGVLNTTQAHVFKRRRLDGSKVTREEFMLDPNLSSREKRMLARGWGKRERKLRRDFNKRGSYISSRIYDLTTNIHNNENLVRRLDTAMRRRDLNSLLAPLPTPTVEDSEDPGDSSASGEDEEGGRKPEMSTAQANRLWYQAYTSLTVLREELKRDHEQLHIMQEAQAMTSRFLRTEAEVKAADAERFELLNKVSLLRHRFSLLQIAGKVQAEGTQECTASTILKWVRQLRTNGGFKRDTRGQHERDWIMSEEDLQQDLLTWMKSMKRLTVKQVRAYINDTLLAKDWASILEKHQLSLPVSETTTRSWMKKLGCTFERASQSFYTDGHERPDVVASRGEYIKRKRKLALRQAVWVQVTKDSLSAVELERLNEFKTADPAENFYAEVYDCEIEGIQCVEFHVDFLPDNGSIETFDSLREALGDTEGGGNTKEGGNYSVRFREASQAPCEMNHPEDVCKCNLPVRHIGQDESVYKAYAREGNEWVVQGVRRMRNTASACQCLTMN